MASSFFTLSFCFLVLCHVCAAQLELLENNTLDVQYNNGMVFRIPLQQEQQTLQGPQQQQQQQLSQRRFRDQSQCRVQSLSALEPYRRIESEAGVTEYWDENNQQFECAGVSAIRHIIEPRGLLLPSFTNAPRLVYIVQGRGILGALIPGCPETYQSIQQSQKSPRQRSQRSTDQHQKIREFRQGDIIALPAGVAQWCYNDGETPLVAVVVHDTSSQANQLDRNLRRFQIAGSQQRQTTSWSAHEGRSGQQQSSTNNIFGGFDVETLAEAFGVSTETARKLQQQDDKRGHIVNVEGGLRVVRPRDEEEEQQQQQWRINGLEETLCSMRLKENIADPSRADVYSPNAGHINSLNSQKLPVLSMIQMSAERGVLYRNAIQAPHWNLNAHSVIYVTRGNGRVQIVGNSGRAAYDGEVQEGQILVVPQNFAVVKQAGSEGFEWISIKTNGNAMTSPLVGKTSAIRAMPTDVLMNAYRISRDEANRLKYNRGDEMVILSPGSRSLQGGRVASA